MAEPGKYVLLKHVQASSKKIKKAKQKKDNQLKKKLVKVVPQKTAGPIAKQRGKIPIPNETVSKKKKKNKQKQDAKKQLSQEVVQKNAQKRENKKQRLRTIEEPSEEPKNFHDDLAGRLKASRFRFMNEQLYTKTGDEAIKVFKEDDSAFNTYHDGYRIQIKQWPLNPLDRIVNSIKKL